MSQSKGFSRSFNKLLDSMQIQMPLKRTISIDYQHFAKLTYWNLSIQKLLLHSHYEHHETRHD